MAGSAGQHSGIVTKWYVFPTATLPNKSDRDTSGELSSIIDGANEVEQVTDVSPLEQGANSEPYSVFGEKTQRSVAGPSTLDDWSISWAMDDTNAQHVALRDIESGSRVIICGVTTIGDGATYDIVVGQVAGKARTHVTDGVFTATLTVSQTESNYTLDKA